MGPVVPNLRFRTEFPDGLPITPSQTAMVDAVLSHYGHLNGGELSELSHGETPWRTTHDGTGRCSAEIQHDLMRSFYTTMVLSGGGPKAPSVTIAPADDEEILQVAAANAERWKDALELLAR